MSATNTQHKIEEMIRKLLESVLYALEIFKSEEARLLTIGSITYGDIPSSLVRARTNLIERIKDVVQQNTRVPIYAGAQADDLYILLLILRKCIENGNLTYWDKRKRSSILRCITTIRREAGFDKERISDGAKDLFTELTGRKMELVNGKVVIS